MQEQLANILKVLRLAERLKFELRHSWLSNGRRESVAEHTWRMSLMAVLLEPYLEKKVDMARMLKMIIIHDLVEAEAGDVPFFRLLKDASLRTEKKKKEQLAIEEIRKVLGCELGNEIYDLWQEFEMKSSYEAKVAHALDRLEVRIQHNEANIDTWLDVEYELAFQLDKHVDFDTTLHQFKQLVEEETVKKLEEAEIDVEKIKNKLSAKAGNQ